MKDEGKIRKIIRKNKWFSDRYWGRSCFADKDVEKKLKIQNRFCVRAERM